LARLGTIAFADDPALGPVSLGNMYELALRDAQSPHVAVRRGDDALHQAEPPIEGDALRRCQRLAVLVEYRNRLAPRGRKRGVVIGVGRRAEGGAQHAAAVNPVVIGDSGLPLGLNLVALPARTHPAPASQR